MKVTKAQRDTLRFLLDNPGRTIFDYYDERRGGSWGMQRLSVRGAAGQMFWRLHDAGLVEGSLRSPIVTAEGEAAASR